MFDTSDIVREIITQFDTNSADISIFKAKYAQFREGAERSGGEKQARAKQVLETMMRRVTMMEDIKAQQSLGGYLQQQASASSTLASARDILQQCSQALQSVSL